MADSPILPGQRAWVDAQGRPLPVEFFRFLRDLVAYVRESDDNSEAIAEILARLSEFESQGYRLSGIDSVQVLGLLKNGAQVSLVNDEAQPLPASFYATDESRNKGWQLLQPNWVPNPYATYMVDENGDYLVDENGNFLTSDDPTFDAAGSAAAALSAANAYTNDEIAALQLSSGTWIPTLTNTTNLAASTIGVGQWIRVADVVNFSIRVSAQAASGTAGAPVATLLGMSMPIAADLTAANQVSGNATIGEAPYVSGQVVADTVNDRFSINWFATSTTNRAVTVTGTYRLA